MNLNEKDYNTVLTETSDFFQSQGVSIIGEGYKEIATNKSLFDAYADSLTEGASADHAETMKSLMENTNQLLLRESSISGIQPIASLSMPVIRKLWPKFALKDALKTEVAKTPAFVVSYTKPYLVGADGVKKYIPASIKEDASVLGKTAVTRTASLTTGAAATVDFTTADATNGSLTLTAAGSNIKKQPLDKEVEIYVNGLKVKGGLDISGTFMGEVVAYPAGTVVLKEDGKVVLKEDGTSGVAAAGNVTLTEDKKVQLIVRFNFAEGTALVAALGDLKVKGKDGTATSASDVTLSGATYAVKLVGHVSPEYNEDALSVGFDIARMDVAIPAGQHINSPLPIESLNDMMALYQIDGTKEAVDLMTQVISQKLDLKILDFLKTSFVNQPTVGEFAGYPSASDYALIFDVRPAAGFAGSPKAWREELKPQLDFLAQKIKNNTYFQSGIFTIVGNPIDINLILNVDWQFRGGQGANMDGVDVNYSEGTYQGANAYKVIASVNVPAGQLYVVFTPSSDTQMTYKYFPYTFSTEMGYIDPNRSKVPSIMMTKRDQLAEFTPAIGCVYILNNDGMGQYNPYVSTKAWERSESDSKSDEQLGISKQLSISSKL